MRSEILQYIQERSQLFNLGLVVIFTIAGFGPALLANFFTIIREKNPGILASVIIFGCLVPLISNYISYRLFVLTKKTRLMSEYISIIIEKKLTKIKAEILGISIDNKYQYLTNLFWKTFYKETKISQSLEEDYTLVKYRIMHRLEKNSENFQAKIINQF